ncbi:MAG: ATP-dependent Clp protease ATP-binding subunit ClpX, partial [Oscillospiraceae bacterium]|nr:ATP-dependent Clp protease ATP-binding subunit ClpX [Oscillospiraceae bacterium]
EDLLKFGLIPEFVGRLPIIVTLDPLDEDALVRILTEPKNALCRQYKRLLQFDNVELEYEPEALEAVAQKAIDRQIGARGLRAVMEMLMIPVMYEIPSDEYIQRVIITEKCVNGEEPPRIIRSEKPRSAERASA